MFNDIDWNQFNQALYETVFMTVISSIFVFVFGLSLGILLYITKPGGIKGNNYVYKLLSLLTSVGRSIPFLILIVLLIPVTKVLIGSILGPVAALPALIIGATPFYARIVELSLNELGNGIIEAAKSFGAKTHQIIFRVIIPEALPSIIRGITVTAIAIVGYTSIAGAIGAGGLGNLAYLYGFARAKTEVTLLATIEIVFIILIIQLLGDLVVNKISKK